MSRAGRSKKRRFADGSPKTPAAQARREAFVERLLLDAQAAATQGDAPLVTLRRQQVESVLPRTTPEFADKARSRLEVIDKLVNTLPLGAAPPEDRADAPAIRKSKWFVLDADEQIHRQHHVRPDRALCGHAADLQIRCLSTLDDVG